MSISSGCSRQKSCSSCAGVHGCHWCGDVATGGCYSDKDWAISCIWSTSCEDLQKCYRTEPEFIGYGSRWVFIFNGAIAISLVLLLTLLGMVICGVFVKVSSSTRVVEDNRYFELSELNEDEDGVGHEEDVASGSGSGDGTEGEDIHFDAEAALVEDGWRYIPKMFVQHTPKVVMYCKKYSISLCVLLSVITLIVVILLVVLSPHMPDFSVCNSELDWKSLISTLKNPSKGIQGNYIMQASIYNPNKFAMVLAECNGYFKYKNTRIGNFAIDYAHNDLNSSFVVPPGSVSDLLFKAELSLSVSTAASMYSHYFINDDLKLTVHTDTVVGIVSYRKISFFTRYNLPDSELSLADLEDSRCKCRLEQPEKT